jgi:hypothetical protein
MQIEVHSWIRKTETKNCKTVSFSYIHTYKPQQFILFRVRSNDGFLEFSDLCQSNNVYKCSFFSWIYVGHGIPRNCLFAIGWSAVAAENNSMKFTCFQHWNMPYLYRFSWKYFSKFSTCTKNGISLRSLYICIILALRMQHSVQNPSETTYYREFLS